MLKTLKTLLAGAWVLAAVPAGSAQSATEILEQARAAYAGLSSYSDTGEVRIESAGPGTPPWEERHAFATHYRAPRRAGP